ncbi:phage major capsid protein [Mycobacterium canettii]|uniref:phage major capsid protein n=1 Tax=Mycobacterium canetti TaxID=78331 RepID=UPI0015EC6568|nr:phage major capsid protein [Mycobacterium canetti]MBA2788276.1 phage major capsid protein [Mycobacterium canetti]
MVETTAANPQLLADQVSALLVQPLEAASVVLSSGPRIFDTSGVLRIPKLTKSSTVGFIGENELIPSDHDTTFDEVVLMPTDRKSIKVIERYSRELARQSVIGIDATLKNRLVKVVSDKLDLALLTGAGQATNEVQVVTVTGDPFTVSFRGVSTADLADTADAATVEAAIQGLSTIGAGNATVAGSAGGPYTVTFAGALAATAVDQLEATNATVATSTEGEAANGITGLINQPGVQTGTLDVADADSLLDAIGLASAAEVMPTRWFVNGSDFIALRKLKEDATSAKYLLESDVTSGPTYRLFGVPVTVTNKLKPGVAILADVSQVAVARDMAPSVTLLSELYADYDQIGIRVVTRYDLGLLHPQAVIVLTAA